jgi:hypothetical protein
MLTSALLLSCASAALASPGFVKLDLEREYGPRLQKRQTSSGDLTQTIVPGENGSVGVFTVTLESLTDLGSCTGST